MSFENIQTITDTTGKNTQANIIFLIIFRSIFKVTKEANKKYYCLLNNLPGLFFLKSIKDECFFFIIISKYKDLWYKELKTKEEFKERNL